MNQVTTEERLNFEEVLTLYGHHRNTFASEGNNLNSPLQPILGHFLCHQFCHNASTCTCCAPSHVPVHTQIDTNIWREFVSPWICFSPLFSMVPLSSPVPPLTQPCARVESAAQPRARSGFKN